MEKKQKLLDRLFTLVYISSCVDDPKLSSTVEKILLSTASSLESSIFASLTCSCHVGKNR